jgi:hypothetical protein
MPDARDILSLLAQLFQENGLEAVMLGNAGAALQGAPVTTARQCSSRVEARH